MVEHWRHFVEAYGWAIPGVGLAAVGGALGAWPALRRGRLALALLPALTFVAFLHQPYNQPSFGFDYNMRYLIGTFAAGTVLALVPLARASRQRRAVSWAVGLILIGAVANAAGWVAGKKLLVFPAVAMVAAAATPWLAIALGRAAGAWHAAPGWLVRAAVAGALVVGVWSVGELRRRQQYHPDYGFRDPSSAKGWGPVVRFVHSRLVDQRIAVTGDDRFFPLYGERFANSVILISDASGADELLRRCQEEQATVLVSFNTVAERSGQASYMFRRSVGGDLLARHPTRVRALFEADGAYVLELLPAPPPIRLPAE